MSNEESQRLTLPVLITHYSSLITSCWETLMETYKVIVAGMGKRGKHHAAAFKNNPRFELAGICSRDRGRLDAAAAEFGPARADTDPLALAKAVRPDIFCFCTPPTARLGLIQTGIESGA